MIGFNNCIYDNLKWYGHLIRMNNQRKTKQVFEAWHDWRNLRKEWEQLTGQITRDRGIEFNTLKNKV